MFAVPGWSVSAANLKSQSDQNNGSDKPTDNSATKKRKRTAGPPGVDSANVAELYEKIIERKKPRRQRERRPRGANSDEGEAAAAPSGKDDGDVDGDAANSSKERKSLTGGVSSEPAPSDDAATGETKKRKKNRKSKGGEAEEEGPTAEAKQPGSSKKSKPAAVPFVPPVPAGPKLTPLQASMREKLVSARFRHLNETLYTRPSTEAFELFEESPEMFQEYHEGFRRQVNVWPENPVDGYIEDIRIRGQLRKPPPSRDHRRGRREAAPAVPPPSGPAPLLRTHGLCTIADLGCGDAKLATVLQADKEKLNLEILSYDLQSPSPLVTRADIANLPLEDGSVNHVIFCLALMGTNWLDFIDEAYRILHWKGELWIAEIKSRFVDPSAAAGKGGKAGKGPVLHSVGNRRKNNKAGKGKKAEEEDEAAHQAALAVAVDGVEERQRETDVSSFVDALRKRGFVLQQQQGEDAKPAVDLSNKMFVKMHFLKGAPATVGKNVNPDAGEARGRGQREGFDGPKRGARNDMDRGKKFLDKGDAQPADEGSILKPCVYKIR